MNYSNNYLRFATNTLLFILIIITFDQVIGRILKHYYFTSSSGVFYKTTFALDSTKADIIILGSSRANHHYVSNIIEDSLGLSCYNAGKDGSYLFNSYGIFYSIIHRYSPKIIILDINPEEIFYNQRDYDCISALLPYHHVNPEIEKVVLLKSNFEKIKLLSAIYPFNSTISAILKSNLFYKLQLKDTLKGYDPLFGSSINNSKPIKNSFPEKFELDSNKTRIIYEMSKECSIRKIKLYIVSSPRYIPFNEEDQYYADSLIQSISKINHGEFLNFRYNSKFSQNPSLFKDPAHMNNNGAILFTNELINYLTIPI